MPLAYYPSYAVTGADPGFLAYARAWLSLGFWPSGPAWFIWLLLVFDAVAAGLYVLWVRWTANTQVPRHPGVYRRAPAFVAALVAVSLLVYVPMELIFGADSWVTLGAFSFQSSRPLLYAAYFLAGIQMGAFDTRSGILARDAGLARRWPMWLSAGLAAYVLQLVIIIMLVLPVASAHRPLPLALRLPNDLTLVLCCGTISFAFIAIFRRFATAHHPVFDSLSASSYGMYLIHYPVVVWLQYALLATPLGPIAKGAMVFVGAVALSWGIAVALRRVPLITRVL